MRHVFRTLAVLQVLVAALAAPASAQTDPQQVLAAARQAMGGEVGPGAVSRAGGANV